MPLWKSILTYDGTPFHGWQVQPGLPTVQGTLAEAIRRITGEVVLPQGSGRTDTGVHALGQVASFALEAPIPASNLHRALNRALPPAIRILSVEAVPEGFHARHSALRKTYEYRIFPHANPGAPDLICPPFLAPFVWVCPWPLVLDPMNRAAAHILGTHVFTSFAASDPDLTTRTKAGCPTIAEPEARLSWGVSLPTNTRTIFHSAFHRDGDLIVYRVTGSGFLHHMVRNLVGTFVETATGRLDPDRIPTILATRNRSAAGPTAPASGLFLLEVEY
jgi:tRNA pseudouridine38-40 synthase